MNKTMSYICYGISFLGGGLSYLLGEWDVLLKSILCLVVLDYITGVLKAIYNKKLCSSAGVKGIIKKIVIFIMIAVANIIQTILDDKIPLREIIITFYIVNESVSVIENATQFIPVPEKIKKALMQIKEENEEK